MPAFAVPSVPGAVRMWPDDWSGPWWLERQRDPASPAFPRESDLTASRNRTGVSWTAVGDLSSPSRILVDPRGYLWVPGAEWGLDWWIGGDDRWHIPAQDAAVRQSLVDAAPIVQTTVRVPSGDVLQRIVVIPGPDGSEAVVEIVNDSAAPVAIALAARPVTLLGIGRIERSELRGAVLRIDGADAVVLPEAPRRALLTCGADPDPLRTVVDGGAPEAEDASVRCPDGRAGAVLVVPLAHRAVWRFRVRLGAAPPGPPVAGTRSGGRRWALRTRGATAAVSRPHRPAPDIDAAARGWRAQVERQVRLQLPPGRVTDAVEALRGHLLVAAGTPQPGPAGAESAVAAATAGYGTADCDGLLDAASGRRTTTGDGGAALWATRRLVALGAAVPDVTVVAAVAEQLARASADPDVSTPAVAWAAAGFAAAATLLEERRETRAAGTASQWRDAALRRLGSAPPADDGRLLAGVLGVAPPMPTALIPLGTGLLAVAGASEADLERTALWAAADLAARDPRWHERSAAVVAAGSATLAWPDVVSTAHGGGCGDDGHSGLVTARLWSVVRTALVDDADGAGPAVLPGWVPAWLGQGLEVHGLPTRWGLVSFALRWHGERPALLWSVDGAPDGVAVSAPTLAPGWAASSAAGEALLPEPPLDSVRG